MERVETEKLAVETTSKVWSASDFFKRHRLCDVEEKRPRYLFGHFPTARELLHNAHRNGGADQMLTADHPATSTKFSNEV